MKIQKTLGLPVLLAAATSYTGLAQAQYYTHVSRPLPPDAAQVLLLDSNGDNQLDRVEATKNAELTLRFNNIDSNADGRLDTAEFSRFEAAEAMRQTAPKGIEDH